MNILIYERDHTGHRTMGVRVLLDALFELVDQSGVNLQITVVTTRAAIDSKEFAEHIAPVQGQIEFLLVPPDAPGIRPQASLRHLFAKLRDLRWLVRHHPHDHLFVPYADGLIQCLALVRRVPFLMPWPQALVSEAVMMRTAFAYSGTARFKRWLGVLGVKRSPFSRVHLIDPQAFKFLQDTVPDICSRVGLIPDIVSTTPLIDQAAARRSLGLPSRGRMIGCLGYLDERKGIDLLVAAFQSANLNPEDRIVLAGQHTDVVRAQLAAAKCDQVISLDRYLSQDEFNNALAAVDLIATPYVNFTGSASIVIRAAAAGRPTIGVDAGWIGYVVPRFALGQVCDIHDPQAFAATLRQAVDSAASFELCSDAQQFIAYNQPGNISAHWTALLRQRLQQPKHPDHTPWPVND